jgi:hypothetical protein
LTRVDQEPVTDTDSENIKTNDHKEKAFGIGGMSVEFATQVGALVGTSLLLFIVTTPRKTTRRRKADSIPLKGVKRYSSYHRKQYYAQASSLSAQ